MSFLTRVTQRAQAGAIARGYVMPKGASGVASRVDVPAETDEADVASLRKNKLRRETNSLPQEDTEAARAPEPAEVAEREEPNAQKSPMRRAAPTSDVEKPAERSLRRADAASGDEEKTARSLRRTETPQPDTDEPPAARHIRRADDATIDEGNRPLRQPFQAETLPSATSPHPDLANMEEPSPLQALRRDVVAPKAPHGVDHQANSFEKHQSQAFEAVAPQAPAFSSFDGAMGMDFPSASGPAKQSLQAEVTIDRVDVIIHEPMLPPRAASARPDTSRLMRARYLNRL